MQKEITDACPHFRPKVSEVLLCCHDMLISTAIRELILETFPGSYIRLASTAYNSTMTVCHSRPSLIIGAVSSPLCVRKVEKQLTFFKHKYTDVPMVFLHDLPYMLFPVLPWNKIISMKSSLEDIVAVFHQALDEPIMEQKCHKKYNFTRRQIQILRLIGEQKKNCEIATELGLHPKTVSSHRMGIRKRLGFTRKQERLFIGEFSALVGSGDDLPFWSEGTLLQTYWEEG